jgi:hypothetical protein
MTELGRRMDEMIIRGFADRTRVTSTVQTLLNDQAAQGSNAQVP